MDIIIITLFFLLFSFTVMLNIYELMDCSEGGCLSSLGSFVIILSPFIILSLYIIASPIPEHTVLFAVAVILTALILITCIVCLFFKRNIVIILNTLLWLSMMIAVVCIYYNQPVAEIKICTQVELENGKKGHLLADTTYHCHWNITDHRVFTVIKDDTLFSPKDKCYWCGKIVFYHYTDQYTVEEYRKKQEQEEKQAEADGYDQFLYNYF